MSEVRDLRDAAARRVLRDALGVDPGPIRGRYEIREVGVARAPEVCRWCRELLVGGWKVLRPACGAWEPEDDVARRGCEEAYRCSRLLAHAAPHVACAGSPDGDSWHDLARWTVTIPGGSGHIGPL
ncbi:MAG: hypothetical protein V3S03_03305 [Vicinamibacteria bacterium]